MCKSLTNYFPRNNDFLVTYFGKTQNIIGLFEILGIILGIIQGY